MDDHKHKNCITADSIDDLLRVIIEQLLRNVDAIIATKGEFTEIFGVLLEVTNPRARISRTDARGTLFSCLGEFLWYMSGSNSLDFIEYYIPIYRKYSDDRNTLYGAYGPRISEKLSNGFSQLQTIINILKKKNTSRRAVIQLFDKNDLTQITKDMPCTCTLQFMIRHNRLQMITNMRSNDALKGLPHDIFAFTLMQELVARSLEIEVGTYKHVVGSLHLYKEDREKAQIFLNQGLCSNIPMPKMPLGDPWKDLDKVLNAELDIRIGKAIVLSEIQTSAYWMDIIRLLLIFKQYKSKNIEGIAKIAKGMSSEVYTTFINKRYLLIKK